MKIVLFIILFTSIFTYGQEHNILIEAENFDEKGGWLVDPQFIEQMGSPYLLAHGLGKPVENAHTEFQINVTGDYKIWVRTKNWSPGNWKSPGRFRVKVDNYSFKKDLGTQGDWDWQHVGWTKLEEGKHTITLIDQTGFDGRCDAIYFSTKNLPPPSQNEKLIEWRKKLLENHVNPMREEYFDLVVVGGGIAGCGAAVAAAEQGLNVALIHDRPVLGGNASGEIRVHTLGIYGHFERIIKMLDTKHYPNGSPKALIDDEKRMANINKYSNISKFLNWRAFDARTDNNKIRYVIAKHTSSGEEIRFNAPLFVDCTGDGWIGYWAGAELIYGRESSDKFNEEWEKHGDLWSPQIEDNFVMGSSVLWRSERKDTIVSFPEVPWANEVAGNYTAVNGEWYWEYARNDLHQINDAEKIRDHMLKAIYGSFYNAKLKPENDNLSLKWVSYLVGKRESRRLVGDYIFTFNDAKNNVKFPDSVVVEIREVDVHFQQNLLNPEKQDFLSTALFYDVGRYYIPYRSLYSKNISNLFMAGRCFSCSHIGLGGPRVMRTTCQMGAAAGYAASLCNKYNIEPRTVYTHYLEEYMAVILSSNN